jgi:tryptophan synthase alpha subunit
LYGVTNNKRLLNFKLYVAADTQIVGSALIQEFEGNERVVAYLSRKLLAYVRPRRSFAYVFITHVQSFDTIC